MADCGLSPRPKIKIGNPKKADARGRAQVRFRVHPERWSTVSRIIYMLRRRECRLLCGLDRVHESSIS